MEVKIGGYLGLMANMPGLSDKDQLLMRTLNLKNKEDNSCGTATRLNSGLHMYHILCVPTHICTHACKQTYLHMKNLINYRKS